MAGERMTDSALRRIADAVDGGQGCGVDCETTAELLAETVAARAREAEQERELAALRAEVERLTRERDEARLAHDGLADEARRLKAAAEQWAEEFRTAANERDALAGRVERAESEQTRLMQAVDAWKERVRELESQIPHPGDGSCDVCASAPAMSVTLCEEHRAALSPAAATTEATCVHEWATADGHGDARCVRCGLDFEEFDADAAPPPTPPAKEEPPAEAGEDAPESLPFCACGRRVSDCDGSRRGCRRRSP